MSANTTRISPANRATTRVYRPGQNASPVSTPENSGLLKEGDAARAEAGSAQSQSLARISQELARQSREDGSPAPLGRDMSK